MYSISGDNASSSSRVSYSRREFKRKKTFSQTFAKFLGFGIIATMVIGTVLLLMTLVIKGSSIAETVQTSGLPFGKKETPAGRAEDVTIILSPNYAKPNAEGKN